MQETHAGKGHFQFTLHTKMVGILKERKKANINRLVNALIGR